MTQSRNPFLAQTLKVIIKSIPLCQSIGQSLRSIVKEKVRRAVIPEKDPLQDEIILLKSMLRKVHNDIETLKAKLK